MNKQYKIFILCGELSADQYASSLVKEMKIISPGIIIEGIGGELLANSGVTIYRSNKDMQVMGFLEVLKHYRMFKNLLDDLTQYIATEKFDAVILIDYPGFNLRLAERLYNKGIKLFYYVCPHVWIWGKKRIPLIKKLIDHNFVIYPFERDFFTKHNIDSSYLGHPILDIRDFSSPDNSSDNSLAILPGSRRNEILRILPQIMKSLPLINNHGSLKYIISASSEDNKQLIKSIINTFNIPNIEIKTGNVEEIIKESKTVIAASGTVCLETALYEKPFVMLYKLNPLTYFIAKLKIKIKHYCIVNIIMGEKIIEELIQNNCNPVNIAKEVNKLLYDYDYSENIKKNLKDLKNKLGKSGTSYRVAGKIIGMLK